jgi:hypothetical protein
VHDCQRYHDLIAAYVAGDIDLNGLEDLVTHCRRCADCRGMVELHRSLATMATDMPEPSAEVFEAMRNRVLDQLEENRARVGLRGRVPSGVTEPRPPFWSTLADWFAAHPLPAPALVVVLILAAGLAGRWSATPTLSDRSLMRAVEKQAGQSSGLDGFWDATFSFANVAVRQTDDGRLALGFDVCRYMEAETPRSSPLAREVLLATIIDSPTLGVRLKAMDMAPDLRDAQLQEALIYTLHNDPDLAVRLEALAALSRPPLDATKQDALLTTLRDDASVEVRLRALEVLVAQRVDPEAILQAASGAEQAGNTAIMQLATEMVRGS